MVTSDVRLRYVDVRYNPAWGDRRWTNPERGSQVQPPSKSQSQSQHMKDMKWAEIVDPLTGRINKAGFENTIIDIDRRPNVLVSGSGSVDATTATTAATSDRDKDRDLHATLRPEIAVAMAKKLKLSEAAKDAGDAGEEEKESAGSNTRKHTFMLDFLVECFDSPGNTQSDFAKTVSQLELLGYTSPVELVKVDYTDISVHMGGMGSSRLRHLLRCTCEFNYYYEAIRLADIRSASKHHTAEEYLLPTARFNQQTDANLHNDFHRSDSNSLNRIVKVHDTRTQSQSSTDADTDADSGIDAGVIADLAAKKEKMERSAQYSRPRSAKAVLDVEAMSGLQTDIKICESQYFRKANPTGGGRGEL